MRLFRRGKVWYVHVYEHGVRRQVSTRCHDRKAAEARARELERDAADPDLAATKSSTLSDAIKLLVDDRAALAKAGKRSADTVSFYRAKASHWIRVLEMGGDAEGAYVPFPLARLTARTVDEFITARRNEGAGENTISKELVALRVALKLARRAGIWRGDPGAILPVNFAPEYKPRERHPPPQGGGPIEASIRTRPRDGSRGHPPPQGGGPIEAATSAINARRIKKMPSTSAGRRPH